jgi:hypothetical protein
VPNYKHTFCRAPRAHQPPPLLVVAVRRGTVKQMARGIVKHVHDDKGELIGVAVQRVCTVDDNIVGEPNTGGDRVRSSRLPARRAARRRGSSALASPRNLLVVGADRLRVSPSGTSCRHGQDLHDGKTQGRRFRPSAGEGVNRL